MKIAFIEKYKNKIGLRFNSPLRKGPVRDYVFIHINKTAGTSIVHIIGKPFRKHLTAKEVIAVIGRGKWDSAYKFTVVRNPWDKMVSHYKHRIKTQPESMRLPGSKDFIGFGDWLRCTLAEPRDPRYYSRPQHFLPQVEWLKDDRGELHMDMIIRFESLAEGFRKVAEDLGLDAELPHLNDTVPSSYRDFYDEGLRNLVAAHFRADIDLFGYRF